LRAKDAVGSQTPPSDRLVGHAGGAGLLGQPAPDAARARRGLRTTGQVTGAQYQRKLPLAADGWRPRFVEQELSVDLTWQGKDGKPHAFRKVPISESLARTIVNGDQVRLLPLPVKGWTRHVGAGHHLDAVRRRASLQELARPQRATQRSPPGRALPW
jgi:hypothetical protein